MSFIFLFIMFLSNCLVQEAQCEWLHDLLAFAISAHFRGHNTSPNWPTDEKANSQTSDSYSSPTAVLLAFYPNPTAILPGFYSSPAPTDPEKTGRKP